MSLFESVKNIFEITDNIVSEKLQEREINEQNAEQIIELSNKHELTKDIDVIESVNNIEKSTENEETIKKIMIFLREKGLSENLIKTLIDTNLTNEYIRLLKSLDLSDDDIGNLQELWRTKTENSKTNNSVNSPTSSSSSDMYLSQNTFYLKEVLSKPLIEALCEIVAKKPADPIEYLGHWLLHFKVCEERLMQQKEGELELQIDKQKEIKDEEFSAIERKKIDEHN